MKNSFKALLLAAGLGLGGSETYPLVSQLFGGFGDGAVIENGTVRPPDAPGAGVETKAALYDFISNSIL